MYPVLLHDKDVGMVKIEREGMFYKVLYQCSFPDHQIYRMMLAYDDTLIDLGVCVPSKNIYHSAGRLPCKNIDTEKLSFYLTTGKVKANGIPVETGKPFAYLDKLDNAYLVTDHETTRIVIDQFPNR